MRLTYETGAATLIQFVFLGILNIANELYSIISTCTHSGGDCVGNLLASVIFYLLIMTWFGIIMAIGYGAQAKRSKPLCRFLIAAEALVVFAALVNIKLNLANSNGLLSLFTSLFDVVLAVWIITLAFKLMRSGGGRIVSRRRVRRS